MVAVRVFWTLLIASIGIGAVRVIHFGGTLDLLAPAKEYAYEQVVRVGSAPGDYRFTMYVPGPRSGLAIRDESIEAGDLTLTVEGSSEGRRLMVEGGPGDADAEIRYTATLATRPLTVEIPAELTWRSVVAADSTDLASTDLVQAGDPSIATTLARLLSEGTDFGLPTRADALTSAGWQDALDAAGLSPVTVIETIFRFCRDDITPATFSGTTDALTALRLRESSCGGKSRLMVAMCRRAGIPARVVGGILLGNRYEKRTSHLWVECRLGDTWVPFDPLNDHAASLPEGYLPLYTGDRPLIRHSRGLAFDYGFRSPIHRVPRAWRAQEVSPDAPAGSSWSGMTLGTIPLLSQRGFSIVLLAPFALLWTVFARQVIGFRSMGTFLPVLIGLALTQTGWELGLGQLGLTVVLGVCCRFLMQRLGLLHVPRNALLITLLVVITLGLSLLAARLGLSLTSAVTILPICSVAMTVERYTTSALDKGHREASILLAQTLILAVGCYGVLSVPFFHALTVAFPEVLLLVMAELVMLGNYRGLRWMEWWRFRHVETEPEPELRRAA